MILVKLAITALEPLVLTNGSAESMAHSTLQYIPGNMLLGAMAFAWRKLHPAAVPDDDPEFRSLFLNADAQWGHAFPEADGEQSVPVPACFMQDKHKGGIPVCGAPEQESYIINCLRKSQDDEKDKTPRKMKKPSARFISPRTFCQPDIRTHWNMHVAIGENRRNAEGQLFGFSSLGAGTKFQAEILCADERLAKAAADLIAKTPRIRVGHARSAGYGLIGLSVLSVSEASPVRVAGKEAVLYLLSDYIPRSCRENPLDALIHELTGLLGKFKIDSQSCRFRTIAGFNGLWRLPSPSRTAIEQGSVLRIIREGGNEAQLPPSLGGFRQEGYGRLLANPAFLKSERIIPTFSAKPAGSEPAQKALAQTPLLAAWRQRALIRQSRERAVDFVETKLATFIEGASRQSRRPPSASQLGNIRRLVSERPATQWKNAFDEMLEKTPGRQWKQATGPDPFEKDRYDNLNVIMGKFLSPETFGKLKESESPDLPGGPASKEEKTLFDEEFRRCALLGLLSAWDKEIKKQAKGGKE